MEVTLEKVKVFLLAIIALCSILITIQVMGGDIHVFVRGGDVDVSGSSVRVDDGFVTVEGSISVDNTVDVNLREALGHSIGCHDSYKINGEQYVAIDVYSR